jgi:hypothetical protein
LQVANQIKTKDQDGYIVPLQVTIQMVMKLERKGKPNTAQYSHRTPFIMIELWHVEVSGVTGQPPR